MEVEDIIPPSGKEVEMVKLAFLSTSGDVKKSTRLSRQASDNGEKVKKTLKTCISEASLDRVREFVLEKLTAFTRTTYSCEAHGENWLQKAEFMTWMETMRYLKLNTKPLAKVEEDVHRKCCMDDLEKDKGAFMFNENMVMSAVCDIMTVEQVKALWTLFCNKQETGDAKERTSENDVRTEDVKPVNFEAPGMKELVFFYVIRHMELKGKFNTLYTDRLLEYLEEIRKIRPSVRNPEKLKQVCEILERYEIMVQPAGYCLVFCVQEDRKGAEGEITNIKNVFRELLGYKVNVILNPTKERIELEAKQCSIGYSHTMFDSLVCWILAHGDSENIVLAEGKKITRKSFLQLFAKETCFSKKPKVFFMATCQGAKAIPVDPTQGGLPTETDGSAGLVQGPIIAEAVRDLVNVHAESDRLVAYATMPDHFSFRSEKTGSLFVSFVCEQIAKLEDQSESSINVVEILQRTARKMQSILFQHENSQGFQGLGKQACYYESTLQKNFCFQLPLGSKEKNRDD